MARGGLRVAYGFGQNLAKFSLCLRQLSREIRFLKWNHGLFVGCPREIVRCADRRYISTRNATNPVQIEQLGLI